MDETQRAVLVGCLVSAALGVGGVFFYWHWTEQRESLEADRMAAVSRCEETIRLTNKYSLVLTDERVRTALECSERFPQFAWFKKLFDERSPNSPTRKPDN